MPNPVGRRGASSRRKADALGRVAAALGGYAQFKQEKSRYEEKLRRDSEDERRRREESDRAHGLDVRREDRLEGSAKATAEEKSYRARRDTMEAWGQGMQDRAAAREAKGKAKVKAHEDLVAAGERDRVQNRLENPPPKGASGGAFKPSADTEEMTWWTNALSQPWESNEFASHMKAIAGELVGKRVGDPGFETAMIGAIQKVLTNDLTDKKSMDPRIVAKFITVMLENKERIGLQEAVEGAAEVAIEEVKSGGGGWNFFGWGATPGPAGALAAPDTSAIGSLDRIEALLQTPQE